MRDTIAGAVGSAGAAAAQLIDNSEIITDPTSPETITSGLISLVVGIVSMLLNRVLNKWTKKKKNPQV